jgi:hypothetical protein
MAISNANIWTQARPTERALRTHVPRQAQLAAIKRFFGCAFAILATAGLLAGIGALKLAIVLSRFNY